MRRVLIAEDEAIVAMDLGERLEAAGYDVVSIVGDSSEIVPAVQESHVDVVLMDIRLRGEVDGVTLAEEIFTCEDTPVIFLSAFSDPDILERAALSGSYGFLNKPVSTAALTSTIQMAIQKHDDLRRCRSEAKWLNTALNAIDRAVIGLDSRSRVRFMNKQAKELTGLLVIDASLTAPVWAEELARMPASGPARQALWIQPPTGAAVQVSVQKYSLGRQGYVCMLDTALSASE